MRIPAIKLFNSLEKKSLRSFGQTDVRPPEDTAVKSFDLYKKNAMYIGVAASVAAILASVLWFLPIVLRRK